MSKKDLTLSDGDFSIFPHNQPSCSYHMHFKFFELVYIMEGKATHYLKGGDTARVKPGDYFIIDIDASHKYEADPGTHFRIINCIFRPVFIDPMLKDCKHFSELLNSYFIRFGGISYIEPPTNHVFYDRTGAVKKVLDDMLKEYNSNLPGYSEVIRCRLTELLIITMRNIINASKVVTDKAVSAVMKYAEDNFALPISLSSAADTVKLTPQYVSLRFKQVTGQTFTEYLKKQRISNSCRLLLSTDKPITEIAELSGYTDIKSFNSVFKNIMHMTPRDLRKNLKKL